MYISLNWIRDFVDLPTDVDPRALAERFTLTTAEVEGIEEIRVDATGLVSAEIKTCAPIPDRDSLFLVTLDDGGNERTTVTAASGLKAGDRVVYAPPGARVGELGELSVVEVAGRRSEGMILPGEAIGMPTAEQEAIRLPASMPVGTPIDPAEWFNDWVIEVDNKSITHRPDLWGHYGIAREFAAIYKRELKPLPVAPLDELTSSDRPEIPIVLDDPVKCPRYTGLLVRGVRMQPAPLWMQVRLAHVGVRPISLLVDLTNYIMAEIGQPMHAFDGEKVRQIEVAVAAPDEKFTTLDGVERTMPAGALMIQSKRRSVALAGIMGGSDTEVTSETRELLLESANFEPATIRLCAAALAHRTDAAARFEKSLDPTNTVLSLQRFMYLARLELPDLKLVSRLTDKFPHPPAPRTIEIDLPFVDRFIGQPVDRAQIRDILERLEFGVSISDDEQTMRVRVPSFRAARDVAMEADVIEEIARYVGYDRIEPHLPEVTLRSIESSPSHALERASVELLCRGLSFYEVQGYIWYDSAWLRQLGYDPGPCIELRNPVAAGLERFRRNLLPGLLAMMDRNRHHFEKFRLVEIGSVFAPADEVERREQRHLGLVWLEGRDEDALLAGTKSVIETWARQVLGRAVRFVEPTTDRLLWESPYKSADVWVADQCIGRCSVVPIACKCAIDEHLRRTAIATAEINLTSLLALPPADTRLASVPAYPLVERDFSVLAPADRRYEEIAARLATFTHPLLRSLAFVGAYQSEAIGPDRRSFTFRAVIGDESRTLTDDDVGGFNDTFLSFLTAEGLELRK